jgi:hypothetical protein
MSKDSYGRERDPSIDAFLSEVIAVCRKHGMSISHEDGHGAFLIERFNESAAEWLMGAAITHQEDLRP